MPSLQPVRYAWRALRRTPVFTVTAVLTLAIGIGAATAIFTVVDGVLLRPLPYGQPDRLVGAWFDVPPLSLSHAPQTQATYFTFQRFAHTISGIAAYQEGAANVAEPGAASAPQRLAAGYISANLVPLLEVAPELGRSFTAAEDAPNGPSVMLISDGLWRTRFGADPGVIGRTLRVDGVVHQIVGVMRRQFRFPSSETEVWLPLQLNPNKPFPGGFNYSAIARLRPGVTIAAAERDFRAVLPRVTEVSPMMAPTVTTQMLLDQAKPQPVLTPMRDDIVGGVATTLWILAGAAGLLLLVACANVANLVLVRADGRQRELAVRAALGAGRARVMGSFLTESAVVAALAGALGLIIAALGVHALVRAGPAGLPRLAEIHVTGAVIGFVVLVTALVALACSAFPAFRFGRAELATTLREGGRGGTAGRDRHRVRGALVAAQIALALVVLAGSGLLLRSFQRLRDVRPGWNSDHLATFWLSLPSSRYTTDSAISRFYAQLTERVGNLTGVRAVGMSSNLPLGQRGQNWSPIWIEGDRSVASKLPPLQLFITTDGGFFHAMDIPLVAGRTFYALDGRQRSDEAIVNRVTAEHFWHDPTGRQALGKRFQTLPNGIWFTIVGVVENAHDSSLATAPAPTAYFPETAPADTMFNEVARTMGLVVRTTGDPGAITPAVQQVARSLDPSLPLYDIRSMADVERDSMARLSFTMLLIGVAAVITLLLGAIGLYGVIAYIVSLRTRELGVRIALGATPDALARLVTRQGLALSGTGIAIGLVLFGLVARFMRSLLYGVAPGDPWTLAAASLTLIVIAVLASWIPARRAAGVDPMDALRAE